MKVSLLDQGGCGSNGPYVSVLESLRLARFAEDIGYERVWIAEHHGPKNTCGSPEVMLAAIAQHTRLVRLGSGASLLPYYSPLRLATAFRLLEYLAPGRIDLAVGRGSGGLSTEQTERLGDRRTSYRDMITRLVSELDCLAQDDYPRAPVGQVWLTGSSASSAALAGELGIPFCYGHFVDPLGAASAGSVYRANVRAGTDGYFALAVHIVCTETEPSRLAITGVRSEQPTDGNAVEDPGSSKVLTGSPSEIADRLWKIVDGSQAEELFITVTYPDFSTKVKTLEIMREVTLSW